MERIIPAHFDAPVAATAQDTKFSQKYWQKYRELMGLYRDFIGFNGI
jgi:hypothetical protein